jgi:hypothetical protein
MNRVFLTINREWIELIIALLWLIMLVAISELELRTVSETPTLVLDYCGKSQIGWDLI